CTRGVPRYDRDVPARQQGSRCAAQGGILLPGARSSREGARRPGAGREPLPEVRAGRARGKASGEAVRLALALALVLAPAIAAAQPYGGPQPNVPEAPRTLDPGAEAKPYTPPPPPKQPAQQKPNIMVVGPDGKVTYSPDQANEPSGYYVDSG